jgi:transposase
MTSRGDEALSVFVGIDWAEKHHDIALVDDGGRRVNKRGISDDIDGFVGLLEMLADAGDSPQDLIPDAIETSRGPLVVAVRATGRKVYPINPTAVERYRAPLDDR